MNTSSLIHPDQRDKRLFVAFIIVCIIAIGLRLAGLFTQFWLDEIWSFNFAKEAGSVWRILTLRHDNNHLLNTLFIYAVGFQQHWTIYRLPALLAGCGVVALAGWTSYQRKPLEGLFTAWLIGFSYFFILYATEARGYAPAVFFCLLAFYALDRYERAPSSSALLWYRVAICLGLMAHLTTLYFFAGLLLWFAYRVWRANDRRQMFDVAMKFNFLPVCFLFALYFVYARDMAIGGGPIEPLSTVLPSAITLTVGGPEFGWSAKLVFGVVALMVLSEIYRLWREGSSYWLFALSVIFIAPAVILVAFRPTYIYPRYFFVLIPFVLWLCSRFLTRLAEQGAAGKFAVVVLLVLFTFGNGVRIQQFLQHGRGHYREALAQIVANATPGQPISIGSDFDFRNEQIVEFYRPYLAGNPDFRYVKIPDWSPQQPEWVIRHSLEVGFQPDTSFKARNGVIYDLQGSHLYSGRSGFNWYVYRRQ